MATTKLTLSADALLVRQAKKLAREQKTSVSAMFSRYIENLVKIRQLDDKALGPLTRRASGMVKLPKGKSEKDILQQALSTKFGLRK